MFSEYFMALWSFIEIISKNKVLEVYEMPYGVHALYNTEIDLIGSLCYIR